MDFINYNTSLFASASGYQGRHLLLVGHEIGHFLGYGDVLLENGYGIMDYETVGIHYLFPETIKSTIVSEEELLNMLNNIKENYFAELEAESDYTLPHSFQNNGAKYYIIIDGKMPKYQEYIAFKLTSAVSCGDSDSETVQPTDQSLNENMSDVKLK